MNQYDKLSSVQSIRYTAVKFWYLVLAVIVLITGMTFVVFERKNRNLRTRAETDLTYEEAKVFENAHVNAKLDPTVQDLATRISKQTDAVTAYERRSLYRVHTLLDDHQTQLKKTYKFDWVSENIGYPGAEAASIREIILNVYAQRVNTSADKRLASQLPYDESDVFKYLIKAENPQNGTITLRAIGKNESEALTLINNALFLITSNPITYYGKNTAHSLTELNTEMTNGSFLDLAQIRQEDEDALNLLKKPLQSSMDQYARKLSELNRAELLEQVLSLKKILIFSLIVSLLVCFVVILILDKLRKRIAGPFDLPVAYRQAFWFNILSAQPSRLRNFLAPLHRLSYPPEKAAQLLRQAYDARPNACLVSLTRQADLNTLLPDPVPENAQAAAIDLGFDQTNDADWLIDAQKEVILILKQDVTTQAELTQIGQLMEINDNKLAGLIILA